MEDLNESLLRLGAQDGGELLRRINANTEGFGLSLSEQALGRLQRDRFETLRSVGRVEFGEGVLLKLVQAFRDSPYISQTEYAETLRELQELFYYYKNECRELVTDDELIEALRLLFNEVSRGSTEYISGLEWRTVCRMAQSGSIAGTELEAEGLSYDEEY